MAIKRENTTDTTDTMETFGNHFQKKGSKWPRYNVSRSCVLELPEMVEVLKKVELRRKEIILT